MPTVVVNEIARPALTLPLTVRVPADVSDRSPVADADNASPSASRSDNVMASAEVTVSDVAERPSNNPATPGAD